MTPKELQARTKRFALDAIALCRELPPTLDAKRIGSQLLDSSTSKLGIVVEEADESQFWLELLVGAGIVSTLRAAPLLKEADELTAIFVQSRITVTGRR